MPEETCPGSTETCRKVCFGKRGRFVLPRMKERLRENWRLACRPDFADRMTTEIRRKGVIVLRVHPVGDFATEDYCRAWLRIMRACPKTRFFAYTRSHAVPSLLPLLAEMAALRCVRLWFSIDRDHLVPASIPPGVRLAYLQVEDGQVATADLAFRVRKLRSRRPVGLPMVCPNEMPGPRSKEVNCGSCQHCWR